MFIVIKSEHYDCTNLICKKDTLEEAVAAVKDSMAQRINKNYHAGLTGTDITHENEDHYGFSFTFDENRHAESGEPRAYSTYDYWNGDDQESVEWVVYEDSPRIVFANKRTVSVQDFCEESKGENKYKLFAATEKQFDQPFSYADFGTRLEEATHGYVKYDKSIIVSKDETTVNRIADMLDSMGFDAVTGYFNPEYRIFRP